MAYTPTSWADGDLITAERLNKMEKGIQEANTESGATGSDALWYPTVNASTGDLSWQKDTTTETPETVNIMGPQGPKGAAFTYADFTEEQLAALAASARSNPNLLDNWYFADPIDQRGGYVILPNTNYYEIGSGSVLVGVTDQYYKVEGYTDAGSPIITVDGAQYAASPTGAVRGYAGSGYGFDRWNQVRSATGFVLGDSYIRLSANTAENVMRFRQRIVGTFKSGTVLTLSALARVTYDAANYRITLRLSKGTAIITPYVKYTNTAGAFQLFSTTVTLTEDIEELWAEAAWTDGAPEFELDLKAVKLELGTRQTLAHQDAEGNWVLNDPPPNKQQELAKCQRYQVRLSTAGYTHVRAGLINSETILFYVPVPVPMRATPSITGTIFIRKFGDTASITDFAYAMSNLNSPCSVRITATKTAHGLDDAILCLYNDVIFDANL